MSIFANFKNFIIDDSRIKDIPVVFFLLCRFIFLLRFAPRGTQVYAVKLKDCFFPEIFFMVFF